MSNQVFIVFFSFVLTILMYNNLSACHNNIVYTVTDAFKLPKQNSQIRM